MTIPGWESSPIGNPVEAFPLPLAYLPTYSDGGPFPFLIHVTDVTLSTKYTMEQEGAYSLSIMIGQATPFKFYGFAVQFNIIDAYGAVLLDSIFPPAVPSPFTPDGPPAITPAYAQPDGCEMVILQFLPDP
jgi:hypothetical protein